MKWAYISGPITGLPQQQDQQPSQHAEARLKASGYEVVNPVTIGESLEYGCAQVGAEPPSWDQYMRADLQQMLHCKTIAMLPGWRESKGARIEHFVASVLGFDVICAISLKPVFTTVELSGAFHHECCTDG